MSSGISGQPSRRVSPEKEEYVIKVFRVPEEERGGENQWQADHGNSHAIGKTPGIAVDRLILFVRRHA